KKCAVGVFTNSRYGWFNEGTADGPSQHLNREFVDALYNDKENTAGVAELISKIETAPWVGLVTEHEPGAQRWVFYDHNVLTDPTLPIWTTKPIDISTSFNTDLKYASDLSVNVTVASGSNENLTCVLIQDNKIFGKSYTDNTGNVTISPIFNDIQLGNASLIVSGYNILPHEYSVNIIATDTAVLAVENIVYNDGNDNIPQNNEQYLMEFDLINYGNINATNVNLLLSSNDTLIKIIDNQYTQGTVLANDTVHLTCVFTVYDTCMNDQHEAIVNINISSDNYSVDRKVEYIVDAAKIENVFVDFTEISGDGDDLIEENESWNINLGFANFGHTTSVLTNALLSNADNDISFTNNKYVINPIAVDDTLYVDFDFSVNSGVNYGLKMNIKSVFDNCDFPDSLNIAFYTGSVDEDFETGDFNKFDWVRLGDNHWSIDSNNPYDQDYSARSGNISAGQESVLRINLNLYEDGWISFYKKISCVENLDFLKFYVDGNMVNYWSGNIDWTYYAYNLTKGQHKLEWKFSKDNSSTNGNDYAMIDNIVFPPFCDVITEINNIQNNEQIKVYPNPFEQNVFFEINSNNNESCRLFITDISGKEIYSEEYNLNIGKNILEWKSQQVLVEGVYFYKFIMKEKIISGKLVKK
ncbi:MAG: T9SS type A sorting domain-containing protein, partial [Bacteroidota bacterium]|nr:T9SS type A sorting domain-containing protein [Bacteroidota bacterium]